MAKSKQRKIEEEKARLLDVLSYMLIGASGGIADHLLEDLDAGDLHVMYALGGLKELEQWFRAIRSTLKIEEYPDWISDKEDYFENAFRVHALDRFETLSSATDHLYEWGFRT
jgi:hypothetical protein